MGKPHDRAAVGMIVGGELQVEQLGIEVGRSLEVADIDDVVLQLGCCDLWHSNMRVHGSGPSLVRFRTADAAVVLVCGCRSAAGRACGEGGKDRGFGRAAIEAFGDKAVRADENAAEAVALGPSEERLIAALQRQRRVIGGRAALMARKRAPSPSRMARSREDSSARRIDADAEHQPLMAAEQDRAGGTSPPPRRRAAAASGR